MAFTWLPTSATFPHVLFERQCIDPGEMYVQAFNSIPPYNVNYKVISGEWPPGLTMDRETGEITGIIDDNEISAPAKMNIPPGGFKYDETNYLQYHRSGVALEFTVRAYAPSNQSLYDDEEMMMYVRTNWSARRDTFVLNIDNQFYVDGNPVDNETYLLAMKERGYFPGPGCDSLS